MTDSSSDDDIKKGLEGIFSGLLGGQDKAQSEIVEQMRGQPFDDRLRSAITDRVDMLEFELRHFDDYLEGLITDIFPDTPPENKGKLRYLVLHAREIERHYQEMIGKFEGHACVADKSRTILRRIRNYLAGGQEVSFDHSEEITYHYPNCVFINHDEVMGFFDGLYSLHYGKSDEYLAQLLWITQSIPARAEAYFKKLKNERDETEKGDSRNEEAG